MRIFFLFIIGCFAVIGVGCAHSHQIETSLASSNSPNGYKVGIGGKEVKVGEKLVVYKTRCRNAPRGGSASGTFKKCEEREAGFVQVLKILDNDSAIVEPLDGLVLDDSMKVEKQK